MFYMYLDDEFFSSTKRNPDFYYPIIGADHLLEKMKNYEIIFVDSVEMGMDWINKNCCPDFISFDNDLQKKLEGKDLAKFIIEMDLDNPGFIPDHFDFFVHSQNIAAKQYINGLLKQYLLNSKERKTPVFKRNFS